MHTPTTLNGVIKHAVTAGPRVEAAGTNLALMEGVSWQNIGNYTLAYYVSTCLKKRSKVTGYKDLSLGSYVFLSLGEMWYFLNTMK